MGVYPKTKLYVYHHLCTHGLAQNRIILDVDDDSMPDAVDRYNMRQCFIYADFNGIPRADLPCEINRA